MGWHLAVDLIEHHLDKAEDRIHRRAQLVRHIGEEIRLCFAGLLELLVQPLQFLRRLMLALVKPVQLLAHVVHMRRQGTELVAIWYVDRRRKVSFRHLAQEAMGFLDGQDKGP